MVDMVIANLKKGAICTDAILVKSGRADERRNMSDNRDDT
jgi:hypothetical protein